MNMLSSTASHLEFLLREKPHMETVEHAIDTHEEALRLDQMDAFEKKLRTEHLAALIAYRDGSHG